MTLRAILRLVAGLALLTLANVSLSAPSFAHEAHGAPAAATQHAGADHAAASEAAASRSPQTTPSDCAGHAGDAQTGKSPCCGNACHAAVSVEPEILRMVSVQPTVQPAPPASPELAGPTVHIKRPPRPNGSPVG